MTKECQECHMTFTPHKFHDNQKFCSTTCNQRAGGRIWRQQHPKGKSRSKICPNCHKSFEDTSRQNQHKYCSDACQVHALSRAYEDQKRSLTNFYASHLSEYEHQLRPYSASPTGRAWFGFAKDPLMPVEIGYGFQGVLIQNETRTEVQCHICGLFYRTLGSHVKAHNITAKEYKEQFGFNRTTGLISDEAAYAAQKRALSNLSGTTERPSIQERAALARESRLTSSPNKDKFTTRERQNQLGTCPLQIQERVYDFIRTNREYPTASNRGYLLYRICIVRFGSWKDACLIMKLPISFFSQALKKHIFQFSDGTQLAIDLTLWPDRQILMNALFEKCPQLQSSLTTA